MDIQNLITFVLLFSSVMSGGLALYAGATYTAPGTKSYVGLMCSVAIYCFGYALELNQSTLQGMFYALRFEYLGIPFLPVFWVILALQYTGYGPVLPKWFYKSLFVLPIITVLLINTNSLHHLHYSSMELNTAGPFPVVKFSKGIWYHVNIFYMDVCFFVGNLLFLRMMLRSVGRTRKQAVAMFVASIIPWVGDFIYQSGLMPYNIDLVPFTFTMVGPLFGLALFRFKMFDFVPIARHTVFDYVKDPVIVLDNADRLADFNRAAARVFDTLSSRAIGSATQHFLYNCPELRRYISSEQNVSEEIELICNNVYHVFELSVVPIEGKGRQPVGRVFILHDITKAHQLLEQLREQAITDGLTGIYNHRYFMELSDKLLQQMIRYGRAASLIIMDLDHFKRVNDHYGHLAGDEVLRRTAALLQGILRDSDVFGRYGGEEFVFFLPETEPDTAMQLAERLRRALAEQEVDTEGQKIRISGSFGVAGYVRAGEDSSLELLCKRADKALYAAKEKGRDRVELFLEQR